MIKSARLTVSPIKVLQHIFNTEIKSDIAPLYFCNLRIWSKDTHYYWLTPKILTSLCSSADSQVADTELFLNSYNKIGPQVQKFLTYNVMDNQEQIKTFNLEDSIYNDASAWIEKNYKPKNIDDIEKFIAKITDYLENMESTAESIIIDKEIKRTLNSEIIPILKKSAETKMFLLNTDLLNQYTYTILGKIVIRCTKVIDHKLYEIFRTLITLDITGALEKLVSDIPTHPILTEGYERIIE